MTVLDSIKVDMNDLIQEAYENGFVEGAKEIKKQTMDSIEKTSYEKGFAAGVKETKDAAFQKGYSAGTADANRNFESMQAATDKRNEKGYNKGYNDGYSAGAQHMLKFLKYMGLDLDSLMKED